MRMQDFQARLTARETTDSLFRALGNLRRVEDPAALTSNPEVPLSEWAAWPMPGQQREQAA